MREQHEFWSRVAIKGDCWEWTGSKTRTGYGQLYYQGGTRRATHVALELDGRPRPFKEACARHHCDNPSCVNPEHLAWGTHQENMQDAIKRNRFRWDQLEARHARMRAARVAVKCAHCGKPHSRPASLLKGRSAVFCSRNCKYASRVSHCKRGHEYTADNTRLTRSGSKICKTCVRLAAKLRSAVA